MSESRMTGAIQSLKVGVAAVLLLGPAGGAIARAQTTYNSPDGHWSIVVPKDWRVGSAEELAAITSGANEVVSRVEGARQVQFVLQLIPSTPDGQFVLVEKMPGIPPGMSFEAWRDALEKQLGSQLKRLEKTLPADVGTASFGQSVIEAGRHRLVLTMDMQGPNGVDLKALSTTQWGVGETINVHAYATRDTFDARLAGLGEIVDSFQFAPGREYDFSGKLSSYARGQKLGQAIGISIGIAAVILVIRVRQRKGGKIVSIHDGEPMP